MGFFKPIQAKPLGTDAMLWQPIEDGEIVPKGGAHAGIVNNSTELPPILAGVMDNEMKFFEAKMFDSFMPKTKTKEQAIENAVVKLRGYFKWTTKDEKPGDLAKWNRLKRGLDSSPNDIAMALINILMFEEPHFCLARDGGEKAFSFNLHYKDSGHGKDLSLLFGFGFCGEPIMDDADGGVNGKPTPDDWERAKQFQNMIVSFARTGVPTVEPTASSGGNTAGEPAVEWVQHKETMNLLHSGRPVSMPFKEEILKFQVFKEQIKTDLKI